jgi:hypothetical protein
VLGVGPRFLQEAIDGCPGIFERAVRRLAPGGRGPAGEEEKGREPGQGKDDEEDVDERSR